MEADHDRIRDAGTDRGLRRGAEDEGPDRGRGRRAGRRDAAPRTAGCPPGRSGPTPSMWSVPAVTASAPSNLSTMAAIVVAASGVPVVKHGKSGRRRSAGRWSRQPWRRSGCASTWALTTVATQCVAESRDRVLLCAAVSSVVPGTHRRYGVKSACPRYSICLGHLPIRGRPRAGLIGCAFADLAEVMAGVFAARASPGVLVVHGRRRALDELTTTTTEHDLGGCKAGTVDKLTFDPAGVRVRPRRSSTSCWGGVMRRPNAAEARFGAGRLEGARWRDRRRAQRRGPRIVAHAGLSSRAEWLPAWEDGLSRAVDAIDSGGGRTACLARVGCCSVSSSESRLVTACSAATRPREGAPMRPHWAHGPADRNGVTPPRRFVGTADAHDAHPRRPPAQRAISGRLLDPARPPSGAGLRQDPPARRRGWRRTTGNRWHAAAGRCRPRRAGP